MRALSIISRGTITLVLKPSFHAIWRYARHRHADTQKKQQFAPLLRHVRYNGIGVMR
jgi:hypothetical protein